MMLPGAVLYKKHIIEGIKSGKIFTDADINILNIGPNSVNVSLGKTLKVYTPAKMVKTFRGDYKIVRKWSLHNLFFFLDVKKENTSHNCSNCSKSHFCGWSGFIYNYFWIC